MNRKLFKLQIKYSIKYIYRTSTMDSIKYQITIYLLFNIHLLSEFIKYFIFSNFVHYKIYFQKP